MTTRFRTFLVVVTLFAGARSLASAITLKPRIVPQVGPSAEVVVADAVVTDWPFLADRTGKKDATQAFTDALAAVSSLGGGTVFAPAGIYRIDGTLVIPVSTTLRGADVRDRSDPNRIGTLLLASFGEGDETAASFITLRLWACVRDLAVWYPSQGFTESTVRPYPFTITFGDCCANAMNVLLYNSYDGVAINGGANHYVADIVGTVLHTGLTAGSGFEYSWLTNVRFGNDTWKSAPQTVILNAPKSDANRLALDTYTSAHVLGAQIGLNTYGMYGLQVRDAHQGMLVKKLPGDPGGFFSVISKVDAPIEDVDGYLLPDSNEHFLDTDNVPGAEGLSHVFAESRGPANRLEFLNVKTSPFNAKGDGVSEDTVPIQKALDAAGQQGGGTVYLPQGRYRVTRLAIPTGVELRGPLGGGNHSLASDVQTCTLLGSEGKNTASPDSDPALLTLAPGSGVRGFDVAYPEQGYGSAAAPVLPYPFTIRGAGAGVWVEDVAVANAYNLIDLSTFRCDAHSVAGVQATVFKTGIHVGAGSEDGRLERVLLTRGLSQGYYNMDQTAIGIVSAYTSQNTVPYLFGNCTRETTFGLDSFDVKLGWWMLSDGGGCTDSTFWQPSSDTTTQAGYLFEGGDRLRFVGVEAGSSLGTSFVSSASFSGSVDVFGTMSWGNARNRDLQGGTFRFHNERSLTLGRPATASSSASAAEGPSNAVDGSEFTKWVSAMAGTNWLEVDLNQPSEIDRWVVRHAGINGEPAALDTLGFALLVSDDRLSYVYADTVANYVEFPFTDRPAAARGRYVRLLVSAGTQYGGDGLARIHEFAVYGKEGWHFAEKAEGWFPGADTALFSVSDGTLQVAPASGRLTLYSPGDLNVQTSRFSQVTVRMKVAGAPGSATLTFATEGDPTWVDSKSVALSVAPSPAAADYTFDFSGDAEWTGVIKQLRLVLQGVAGASIESISFAGVIDPGFAVTGISPASGPAAGGIKVTISGSLFQNDAGVEIGGAAATAPLVGNGSLLTAFTPALLPGTLSDVVVTNPDSSSAILPRAWLTDFADVPPSEQFHNAIERVFRAGIASGCGAGIYCPADTVSRAQMGIFIARVIAGGGANIPISGIANGKSYNCVVGGESAFDDVSPTDIFCKHVHYLATQKITLGCTPTTYCPTLDVLRQEMAAFVAKRVVAQAGGSTVPLSYGPDPVTGRSYSCDAGSPNLNFTDVLVSDVFCKHVHYLWAKGVIAGCSAATYCPTGEVTRDQMAKFLVNAFELKLYGP